MRKIFLKGFICFAFLTCMAKTGWAQQDTLCYEILVVDEKGKPIPKAEIISTIADASSYMSEHNSFVIGNDNYVITQPQTVYYQNQRKEAFPTKRIAIFNNATKIASLYSSLEKKRLEVVKTDKKGLATFYVVTHNVGQSIVSFNVTKKQKNGHALIRISTSKNRNTSTPSASKILIKLTPTL